MLRGDLVMSEGKANAQAGHAYVNALLHALSSNDPDHREAAMAYAGLCPGTKVCLDGGSGADLDRLGEACTDLAIPHIRIYDQDHVEPPHFDGSRILTAMGIGPIPRDLAPKILRRLRLWAGGARTNASLITH